MFKSSYLCESQQTTIPFKIHVRALQNLQSTFQGEAHLQRSEPVALSNTALRNDFHPYVSLLPLWISFSVNSQQAQTTLVRNECLHWSFLLSFWDVASVERHWCFKAFWNAGTFPAVHCFCTIWHLKSSHHQRGFRRHNATTFVIQTRCDGVSLGKQD